MGDPDKFASNRADIADPKTAAAVGTALEVDGKRLGSVSLNGVNWTTIRAGSASSALLGDDDGSRSEHRVVEAASDPVGQ